MYRSSGRRIDLTLGSSWSAGYRGSRLVLEIGSQTSVRRRDRPAYEELLKVLRSLGGELLTCLRSPASEARAYTALTPSPKLDLSDSGMIRQRRQLRRHLV